jgi:hypothetical protein
MRKKKIRRPESRPKPNLAQQYREIQWLRELVKYFERIDRERRRD